MDDRTQLRIALEAEAMLGFVAAAETGRLKIVSSEVLLLEANKNPDPQKRAFVLGILDGAAPMIGLDAHIESRAKQLESRGFKAFDALHIATAESATVYCFCTCDDGVLRKARTQTDLTVRILSPLELADEVPT